MKTSVANRFRYAKCTVPGALVTCRKMMVRLALLVAMLLPSVPVPAQKAEAAQRVDRHKPQTLDERVQLLVRYLNLTDGQRSALKSIILERQQDIFKMRHATGLGEVLQMDRFRAIEDKTAERIRAMLTEEQRKKYGPLGGQHSTSAKQNVGVEDWLKNIGPR